MQLGSELLRTCRVVLYMYVVENYCVVPPERSDYDVVSNAPQFRDEQ